MQTSRVREAIRDSINRRYDLIHYIYSTVETTTQTAEPLMRPMWSEFPNESRFWDVASQFMFGSSILVAPKVTRPQGVYKHMHMQEVTYALPEGESWFNYYSKASVESTPQGEWVTDALPDLEQAVYVRGGTVLPIMMHDDCPSILACIGNDLKLEIYPDADSNATGTLYLDDGSSYEFVDKDAKSARVSYSYNGGMISTSLVHGDEYQNFPNVSSIVVYGVDQAPEVCRTGAGE